jgi:hypothetical protein
MVKKRTKLIAVKRILKTIIAIRGEKVILDSDLAELYGVETRRLNEQVRRNIDKFPEDFMFQLTTDEFANLKSQIATSSPAWGGRRKSPLVFTKHGVLQAANILNSPQANKMRSSGVRPYLLTNKHSFMKVILKKSCAGTSLCQKTY